MRTVFVALCIAFCIRAQDPYAVAGNHYRMLLENDWVRVSLVSYGPHESTPVHDHSATPTAIYVYLTDAGPLRFKHMTGMKVAGEVVTRPAVKAGEIRLGHSAPETHSTEYLGDAPMKYLRIELRTEVPEAVVRNVRIQPPAMERNRTAVLNEFENGQVRILRVICARGDVCPASQHPDDPALEAVMSGPEQAAPEQAGPDQAGMLRWCPAAEKGPVDAVRLEFKTEPVRQSK